MREDSAVLSVSHQVLPKNHKEINDYSQCPKHMYFEQENIMLKNVRGKTDTGSFNELFKKSSKMEHKKSFIPYVVSRFNQIQKAKVLSVSRY